MCDKHSWHIFINGTQSHCKFLKERKKDKRTKKNGAKTEREKCKRKPQCNTINRIERTDTDRQAHTSITRACMYYLPTTTAMMTMTTTSPHNIQHLKIGSILCMMTAYVLWLHTVYTQIDDLLLCHIFSLIHTVAHARHSSPYSVFQFLLVKLMLLL